jgi:hypothetical protein
MQPADVPDVPEQLRKCTGCGLVKPLNAFRKDRRKPSGRGWQCVECANAWSREFRRAYKARTGTHVQYRYAPHQKLCETCGKPFDSREARIRFCSIACNNRSRTWAHECERCGKTWESGHAHGRFCSAACRTAPGTDLVLWRPVPPWVRIAEATRRLGVEHRPLRKRWYAGRCARCGDWFVHDQPSTMTCSVRCMKRQSHDRRRLRERMHGGAPGKVSRWRIFERDEWTCQICGLPTERSEKTPHPLAPTLDHVIPLALWPGDEGAVHEDSNLQCAHFLCNSIKGDRIAA